MGSWGAAGDGSATSGSNGRRHRLRNGCLALVAAGAAFLFAAPISSAEGATYFVAPTGSGADCLANSQSNPFAGVQAAIECVEDGDVIQLAPSGGTPYPGIGTISEDVTIEAAPGADARSVEVDLSSDLVTVPSTTNATIEGIALTCVDGLPPTGGVCGPNVTNHGTLTLREVSLRGSTQGAGIRNLSPSGGSAHLTVLGSTISDNTAATPAGASSGFGAGIESALATSGTPGPPTVAISNSTIADNGINGSAQRGGGLDINSGVAVIVNSTITGNEAIGQGGGGIGTGVSAAVALSNTVVAGNTTTGSGPDCLSPTGSTRIVDGAGGHNLIGSGAGCGSLVGGVNGDQVGVPNPGLNDLADNGGPTDTLSLQASSPAIAAADVATCEDSPVTSEDQRGEPRDNPEGCDIGAFDTSGTGGVVNQTYFVAPTGSGSNCGANSQSNPFATAQAALACTADGDVIRLAPSGASPYAGIGPISENVRIEAAPGADARSVEIDVSPDPAEIPAGTSATIENVALTCVDGLPPALGSCGPNVTNHGSLALRGVAVSGSVNGAGIRSLSSGLGARLTVVDSTISGNPNGDGTDGGGILSNVSGANPTTITKPTVTVANSTIADNGQGAAAGGGGVYVGDGSATLTNATITGNHAIGGGAGGGIGTGSGAEVELSNTVVSDNTAPSGAPDCDSPAVDAPITDGPGGHNLIGDGTGCTTLTDGVNGDQVGVADPGLNALADNGGPTDTVSLRASSPAIGAADSATCAGPPISGVDQRGELRNQSAGCDIGAFEAIPVTLSIDASPNVTIGGSISATATINGLNPTGELTFNVYGPDDPSCTRINPAFTDTKAVSGNGAYVSADFTPSAAGTYRWTASYGGDAGNDPAASPCNAPGSSVTVTGAQAPDPQGPGPSDPADPDPGNSNPTDPDPDPDPTSSEPEDPSNEFTVGKLDGMTLELNVASPGEATVADAAKRLKPSSAKGGPGELRIKLRLTKPAKQTLKEDGKVRVEARITFTPDGGSPNTRTQRLRIKGKR